MFAFYLSLTRFRASDAPRQAVAVFSNAIEANTALRLTGAMIVDRYITVMPISTARASGFMPSQPQSAAAAGEKKALRCPCVCVSHNAHCSFSLFSFVLLLFCVSVAAAVVIASLLAAGIQRGRLYTKRGLDVLSLYLVLLCPLYLAQTH